MDKLNEYYKHNLQQLQKKVYQQYQSFAFVAYKSYIPATWPIKQFIIDTIQTICSW